MVSHRDSSTSSDTLYAREQQDRAISEEIAGYEFCSCNLPVDDMGVDYTDYPGRRFSRCRLWVCFFQNNCLISSVT